MQNSRVRDIFWLVCLGIIILSGLITIFADISAYGQTQGPELGFYFNAFTPYRSYPSGTVFEENWAATTPNPDLCWTGGPTGCNQTWTVNAGTGEAIVTAPSGFTEPEVLELPSATTAINLSTSGTIPGIPAGASYTLTADVMASGYGTGASVLNLEDSGTSVAAIGVGYGTGFFSGSTPTCGTAANTVNVVKLVINGASSQFWVNGTQCGSDFTAGNYPANELVLTGNTGENVWVGNIAINGSSMTGGWWPSVLADWAGQSGVPTLTTLAAGTHGWGSNQWSQESTVGVTYDFVSACQPYPSSVSIWNQTFTGNSCISLQMNVPTTAGASGGYVWTSPTNQPNESVGFFFEYSVPSATGFTWTDFTGLYGDNGSGNTIINNLQLALQSGQEHVLCEVDTGSGVGGTASVISNGGTPVNIAQNTWYWVSYDATRAGNNSAWLYSASGTYLGTCAFATGNTMSVGAWGFSLAKEGSETEPDAGTINYSNVLFSFADAPAPLLPPGFPQP